MPSQPDGVQPATSSHRRWRRKPDFVSRTIVGVTGAIEQAIYSESMARTDGFLQRVDPRAKAVMFGCAIVVAGLSRSLVILLCMYGLLVILALASKLSLGFFVKRVLVGVPLFAGIIYLPALFLISGEPVISLQIGPLDLSISGNALMSCAIFLARVAVSVSLAVLLVVTTRWADLLKAMHILHIPGLFIVVLGMTYRYIFLFLQTVENLFLARKSRTVGRAVSGEERQWIGATMGALLSKSFKTSDDVYQAMVSRGFTGNVRTMAEFSMRDEDWLFVSGGIVLLASALLVGMGM